MADIKFSEFPKANQSKDSDEIAILQDGVNKMIPSPVLESKIINKTVSRVLEQGGASLNVVNLKGVVPTYADLALITPTPNLNDAYQVEADGLVYVYTESGFQSEGDGFVVQPEPNGVVEEGNPMAVSGGEVFENVKPIDDVLFEVLPIGTNFISELTNSNLNNTDLWVNGMLQANGAIANFSDWKTSKKFYKIENSNYDVKLGMYGNSCICYYDANYTFIGSTSTSNAWGSYYVNNNLPKFNDAVYFRISHSENLSTSEIYFKNKTSIKITTSDTFLKTEDLDIKTSEYLENFKVQVVPIGTSYISELIGSNINDTNLWGNGYLNASGVPAVWEGWKHSFKYYLLPAGTYSGSFFLTGNAKLVIYDANFAIKEIISNPVSAMPFNVPLEFQEDVYVRFSHQVGTEAQNRTNFIKLNSTSEYYPTILTDINLKDFVDTKNDIRNIYKDMYRPKKRYPLVTLIADDGSTQDLEWYVPMLDEYGVKSTFALIGSRLENSDRGINTSISINSQQARILYLNGHDIASHTWTHTQNWNTVLTLEQIEYEMSRTKIFLEKITFEPVNMFISPFGIRSSAIDNIISKYYDANFISGYNSGINEIPLDNYFINRVSFDAPEASPVLNFDTVIKPAIDDAIANNRWLVFAVHPAYAQYNSWSQKEARKNELRQLIEYCQAQGVEITTAKKGYSYYKNFVNIGVRRFNERVYQLGMDGSEYNINYFEF